MFWHIYFVYSNPFFNPSIHTVQFSILFTSGRALIHKICLSTSSMYSLPDWHVDFHFSLSRPFRSEQKLFSSLESSKSPPRLSSSIFNIWCFYLFSELSIKSDSLSHKIPTEFTLFGTYLTYNTWFRNFIFLSSSKFLFNENSLIFF